jgi:hypothetical protein
VVTDQRGRTAATLSFLLPGLGQVYQQKYFLGGLVFAIFTALNFVPSLRLLLLPAALLAAWDTLRIPPTAVSTSASLSTLAENKPQRQRLILFSIVGIFGFISWFLIFASPLLVPFRNQIEVNEQVERLATRVRAYEARQGQTPASLAQCVSPEEADGLLKDPWGTLFQLQASPDGFEIRSAGPDRTFGTKDDYSYHFRPSQAP